MLEGMEGSERVPFADICSVRLRNDAALTALATVETTLETFPTNATDLVQPADYFTI